ncbi:endopeptidase La [Geobacter pelophilus]|uniref:Lon protease n=1 Tax=Geoanaerobacter pelophilus TaxID=60036 RepID=A0AAW4L3I6_9BACT|nr:endopeptidase La [Geoanaerobacter pelophilus]MBT0662796.1 endopeptidase La [Geoanaerobacter pelophilus]
MKDEKKPVKKSVRSVKGGGLKRFPLLTLRDMVIFPHMVVPLFVGREKSVRALEISMSSGKEVFLAAQMTASTEDPSTDEIYSVGTVCQILQLLKLPDGTVKVLIEGKRRGEITAFINLQDYLQVDVRDIVDTIDGSNELDSLVRVVTASFENYLKLNINAPQENLESIKSIKDPGQLADSLVSHISMKLPDKQALLSMPSPVQRLERLLVLMEGEIEILQIDKKIKARVKKQIEKTQKEYYLNEQMRAIQKELGNKDDYKQEIRELEEKVQTIPLSEEAKKKALAELKKLQYMSPMSAEAAVSRNYLDWLFTLPWGKLSEELDDLLQAEEVLNADHYGLEKVKERIIEFLAVRSLVKDLKGPILCLVGPPGVGKTSLARSIARATGRNFVKMSLGGVRDEAEIRGHRRTYIGSMPGRIVQSLKKAGTNNPVFLLDEIDKLSSDFRGDPASALLEVLDPEQNLVFSDHFMDIDYDLSRVMFITTANSLHSIPRPLLDRLEIVKLEGYTEKEKVEIAKRHLVRKQLVANGLLDRGVSFNDSALSEIIRHYTRESGVRNLEREISGVCRKVARLVAAGSRKKFVIRPVQVREFLGARKIVPTSPELGEATGLVTGLAWTETGGDLLSIEVAVLPGNGKLTITGKLGDVMQESAHAALSYVRSRAQMLGLARDFYKNYDLHIHVPEGAIPKDGPSAGITMATAIASALSGMPVRARIAMTGEITLRGRVLPIGGLKEKLLAARRGQIRTVIIPQENQKDLDEIPDELLKGVTVKLVSHMDEVLAASLSGDFSASWLLAASDVSRKGSETSLSH